MVVAEEAVLDHYGESGEAGRHPACPATAGNLVPFVVAGAAGVDTEDECRAGAL